jgi:hypothetical protein
MRETGWEGGHERDGGDGGSWETGTAGGGGRKGTAWGEGRVGGARIEYPSYCSEKVHHRHSMFAWSYCMTHSCPPLSLSLAVTQRG